MEATPAREDPFSPAIVKILSEAYVEQGLDVLLRQKGPKVSPARQSLMSKLEAAGWQKGKDDLIASWAQMLDRDVSSVFLQGSSSFLDSLGKLSDWQLLNFVATSRLTTLRLPIRATKATRHRTEAEVEGEAAHQEGLIKDDNEVTTRRCGKGWVPCENASHDSNVYMVRSCSSTTVGCHRGYISLLNASSCRATPFAMANLMRSKNRS